MNRADLARHLVTALEPIFGAGRVTARTYDQAPNDLAPTWPAARYTASALPTADICGGGDGSEDDVLFTIEISTAYSAGEAAHTTLVASTRAAVNALGSHWVFDSEQDSPTDLQKKVVQSTLDFIASLSSGMVSPP